MDSGGEKDVLVCMHGWPTASWDFARLFSELSQRFRVIAPDVVGAGFSDKPLDYPYSLLDQAELHVRLLEHLGVTSAHFLVHDYAVGSAQELLARQLDKSLSVEVKSLCFLNGGLFPEVYRPRPIQRLLNSPLGAVASRCLTFGVFRLAFSRVFGPETKPTHTELRDFWDVISCNSGLRVQHLMCRMMFERIKYRDRWRTALTDTRVPLRFINGSRDPNSGEHMAARYEQVVPHPDVVRLADVGHYPHFEAPQRVLAAFMDFVRHHIEPASGTVPSPSPTAR